MFLILMQYKENIFRKSWYPLWKYLEIFLLAWKVCYDWDSVFQISLCFLKCNTANNSKLTDDKGKYHGVSRRQWSLKIHSVESLFVSFLISTNIVFVLILDLRIMTLIIIMFRYFGKFGCQNMILLNTGNIHEKYWLFCL